MSPEQFNYILKDDKGNPVGEIKFSPFVPSYVDKYGQRVDPESGVLEVRLSSRLPKKLREETLQEYHSLAGILGFESKVMYNE